MPRSVEPELKYTKEIIIYMVQNGNVPTTASEITDGLGLNYSQVLRALNRGKDNNRFKQVYVPAKGSSKYYVSLIKTFKEIEDLYGIQLERSATDTQSVIFVKKKGKGDLVSVAPLARNISVEGRPITDWMEYMAERAVAMVGLANFVNTWPQILGEMADIAVRGLNRKDEPLTTQIRVDKLWDELNLRFKVFERMMSIFQELKENPILWTANFYRQGIQELRDLQITEEQLSKYSTQIEANYGKLVFRDETPSQ